MKFKIYENLFSIFLHYIFTAQESELDITSKSIEQTCVDKVNRDLQVHWAIIFDRSTIIYRFYFIFKNICIWNALLI